MTNPFARERKNPFTYTFEHGSYYWWGHSGLMENMSDQVAFAFDRDTGTMFKHGAPERIEKYAREANARLAAGNEKAIQECRALGLPDPGVFAVAVVVFPRETPVEELNRCVQISGYLKVKLQESGVQFPDT